MTNTDPKRRFEDLCDQIAIEQDVQHFSALVTELNQLDPSHHQPVIFKQATSGRTLPN